MNARFRRVVIRATLIGVQWVFLTTAVDSLVMRSEASFDRLISPHFGAAPMFIGAFFAALLLGLTIEAPRFMVPLVLLMCVTSAAFFGVLGYAPVVSDVVLRTTTLDNWILQRTSVVAILLALAAVPGAALGNLLGGFLDVRQEIAPHPEDLREDEESPWWERRDASEASGGSSQTPQA